ncbi:MAG: hypothetical protein HOV94_21415 [Saccharothrix sp.]|nr:hypothetical protein [Saccharothrix sp.]
MGNYSFLPWLRRGIASSITAQAAPGSIRATVPVDLTLSGDRIGGGVPLTRAVHRDIELYGPAEAKFEEKWVVRTEPRSSTTDFEPNYLAFIEFYDEDVPWRYTPAPPNPSHRLQPWLALLVLTEDEFAEPRGQVIAVEDTQKLPLAADLWAFAHVHVNRSLAPGAEIVLDDMGQVLPRFDAVMAENPDLALSRLMSPRHLLPDTRYHAFVVPAFESGRLAGLGLDPHLAPAATAPAWGIDGQPESGRLPYYYHWEFRTGTVGDFEYLVRLLRPRKVDPSVGQRDMDVQRPLPDLPGITDPALHGVLRLGGALRVPETSLDQSQRDEAERYENWDVPFPHAFQVVLAGLINLAADYESGTASEADPVITPPLYGRWHALTSRLLAATTPPTTGNWVHELNLDPRFRVPAGFGTGVVQEHQEEYMAAAWDQVGAVLAANRRIRLGHLAREIGGSLHRRHLAAQLAADPGRVLALTAPAHPRVLADAVTVAHFLTTTTVGAAPLSAAMRRIVRPGSRLVRSLGFPAGPGRLLAAIAEGRATPAHPKKAPSGAVTLAMIADKLRDQVGDEPGVLLLDEDDRDPGLVERLERLPDFRLVTKIPRDPPRYKPGGEDSRDAVRFKEATAANAELIRASTEVGREPNRGFLDVPALAAATLDALRPDRTVPRKVLAGLRIPARLRALAVEQFREVMAYPEIDVPMYRPLVDSSAELFVPNLNLIPQNTITLLETNQRFIESYLVGCNHEMARELLWREYPTDQQGSYFRQFWDPSSQRSLPGETAEQRRERLRDIPPLHHWSLTSTLGSHDNREAVPGTSEEEVVLVIRGDLLKRYPTAVIYAHRAKWRLDDAGNIDPSAERELDHTNPDVNVKLPLYEAKVDPDIYFFGFDLTAEAARGDDPDQPAPDPGWFFVIRERPGEPRFGLDIQRTGGLQVWNDLAWDDVAPTPLLFIPTGSGAPTRTLTKPAEAADVEKLPQWEEDKALHWGADLNSSEIAYILYQAPVLVAVHAQEMLGHG